MRKKFFRKQFEKIHTILFFLFSVYVNDVDMCLVDKKCGNYDARMNKEKI